MKRLLVLFAALAAGPLFGSSPETIPPGWQSASAPSLDAKPGGKVKGKLTLEKPMAKSGLRVAGPEAEARAMSTQSLAASDELSIQSVLTAPTPLPGGNEADIITPEITNLARSLQYSPAQIFEYVLNAIDYEHYYGSKKGALLTLLEGSGNDLDQSALLVSLLRASGIEATYQTQWQLIPYDTVVSPGSSYNAVTWLGLAADPFPGQAVPPPASRPAETATWSDSEYKKGSMLLNYFSSRGFRCLYYAAAPGHIIAPRTIVRATVGGVAYDLDPSVKLYSQPAAMDFVAATGFNATQKASFLTALGGTTTSTYTSGLNLSAVTTQHTAATTNLINTIRATRFTSTTNEILGQGENNIVEITNFGAFTYFPYFTGGTLSDGTNVAPQLFTAIATSLMSSIEFQINSATTYTLTMPKLQGQRLWIYSTSTTAAIRLEDTTLTQASVGATYNLRIKAKHPHFDYSVAGNPPIHDQQAIGSYKRGSGYAIVYGFAPGRRYLLSRERVLEDLTDQVKTAYPAAISSGGGIIAENITDAVTRQRFLSELLNVQGINWLYQTYRAGKIAAGINGLKLDGFHAIGRMGREGGLYIDVPLMYDAPFSKNGLGNNNFNYGLTKSYLFSALEHSIVDQYSSSAETAVSTIQIMHLANTSTDPNKNRIYLATTANWTTVQAELVGYTATQLTEFQGMLTGGASLLLPRNAANTKSGWTWSGGGYVKFRNSANDSEIGMIISGNYAGGYSGYSYSFFDSTPISIGATYSIGNYYSGSASVSTFRTDSSINLIHAYGADPVDMATGAMVYDHDDLSVGGTNTRGLNFARHYSSNLRSRDTAKLGNGWTHNYDLRAVVRTANEAGLGEATPTEAAQIIAAAVMINELVKDTTSVKSMAAGTLVAKVSVDHLLNNAVVLSIGKESTQFIKQPDGTYTPPAASTMSLVKTGNHYIATERFGNAFKFDSTQNGRIVDITDLFGKKLTFAYGTNGLSTVTDAYSRTLTFNYTGGRISSITDSTGRSVQYGYTGTDLTSYTDPESKTTTYGYDTKHRLTLIRDPEGRDIVVNRYDSESRVYEQDSMGDTNKRWLLGFAGLRNWEADPDGNVKSYYYDKRGRLLSSKDALGNRTRSIYDGQSRVVAKITPKGEIFSYEYDVNHNLKKEAGPQTAYFGPGVYWYSGNIAFKDYTYDTSHRLTQVDASASDEALHRITAIEYTVGNTTNLPNKITDPKGNVSRTTYYADGNIHTTTQESSTGNRTTTYVYDVRGMPQTVTYPDTKTQSTVYNVRGDLTSQTDRRGKTSTFTYNNRRQVLTSTAPGNLVTTRTYDDSGNLATVTDPSLRVTRYTYSATGKKLTETIAYGTAEAETTTHVYNASDWLDYSFDPRGAITEFGYDAAGRLTSVTDPMNRTVNYGYDANGNRTSTETPLGFDTTTTYTALGKPDIVTDPATKTVDYGYNGFGEQKTLKNRRNQTFQFGYDLNGNPTTTKTPLNHTSTKAWNDRNLLGSIAEPSGQTTSFEYDDMGRAWRVTDPTGQITTTFDDNGNPLTVTEGAAVLTRTFDDLNRPATYTNARGETLGYTYYPNGLLWKITYPGARDVIYTYYATNRLHTVTDWAGRVTTYFWDSSGRLVGLQRPNGVRLTQTFDDANRLERVYERNAAGDLLFYVKYAYDADGRLINRYRLPQPQALTIPLTGASFDADNRIQTWASVAVTHDVDGNMTSGPFFSAGFAPYIYDSRNRLVTAGNTTSGYTSYAYDAENNRVSQTDATGATRYLIDPHGGSLPRVAVREKPSGAKTSYVYGLGLLYEVNDATGDATYYHYDVIGSTIGLTGPTGTVTDRVEYSPYGAITQRVGTTDTPFLYVGQAGVMTDANKLLYMRARYYSPELMRFINADPIGFGGGLNWYAYANGNPGMLVDPDGRVANFLIGALVGVAVQAAVDLARGEVSSFGAYAGAAAGGALTGGLSSLVRGVGSAAAVGVAGGLVNNGYRQTVEVLQNDRQAFSGSEFALNGVIGGGASVIGSAAGAWINSGGRTTAMNIVASRSGAPLSGSGPGFHVVYSAGDDAAHAAGSQFFAMETRAMSQQAFSSYAGNAYASFRLPVANPSAVTATGLSAWSCVTGAASAFGRGWTNQYGSAVGSMFGSSVTSKCAR